MPHALPTRRRFLGAGAAITGALAAPSLALPRRSLAEELSVACVGVGGMGASDLGNIASGRDVRIAALCDVDANRLAQAAASHPDARTYSDWRRLLDELEDQVDAISISTPDHMHAPIALAALDRGKHVYIQKPVAHDLRGCRALQRMAAERGLVSQMGTQIHSHAAYRSAVAHLEAGTIGKVREAHLWVSKSWAGPAGRSEREDPVPEYLDWDLWLGVARERPYVEGAYHPAQWRGWKDFGSGTLGDMGCHIFDPVFAGLKLGPPTRVTSHGPAHRPETFAADGDVRYEFPATDRSAGPLRLRWTDGSAASRPDAARAQLPEGEALPGAGSFLVGEKGVMVIPHWSAPRFYAEGKPLEVEPLERDSRNHYHEWTDACRSEGSSSTPLSYSCPLTEAVLVGVVAGNFPGQTLTWNSEALRFDHEPANALVARPPRDGWSVPGF